MNAPALPAVPDSVIHLLRDAARETPDLPALFFEGARLNYAQYAGLAGALARRLGQRVRPGDRVALLMQNSLDLAVATFAVHALRAQAVPLNPGYRERELAYMLEDAAPRMLLHDDSVKLDLAALCPGLDAGAILRTGDGAGLLEMLPQACALPQDLPRHEDLATLQYTGGTTGRPKGVNILHRQIAYNIAQREAWLPTRREAEVVLCVMPLFHVSAVSMSLYLSLHARGELVVMRRFDATRTIEAIAAHRVTLLPGAPAVFHDLLLSPALSLERLASLRACFSGAAPLPRETLARFEQRAGCPIHEGYGMSEAGPCLAFNPMHRPRKPGSVGLPVPGGELQVVDLDHGARPLPPGQPGEIRVRGPHVMAGYRQPAADAAQALSQGWFYTGDVAVLDEEGYLHLQGRRHDCINVGGFKVYPLEVEQVLLSRPEVGEAAAFGVADERLGQVVHAWVTPAPGQSLDTAALQAHCAAHLAGYKVPRRIGAAQALPRTSIGKLARGALAPVAEPGPISQ
ncbi:class I adenylate-forming enzyme family protein [Achromobacter xylosoxidans]|uniref:class I adenylate-forming enzyme family protein n=1 Tax=Alcaligenes xylosoxydans xylosoxydans TaxID=85698 RepID=UPI000B496573|nr:AMP-binding protein [Achromobacter xylosoxidans]